MHSSDLMKYLVSENMLRLEQERCLLLCLDSFCSHKMFKNYQSSIKCKYFVFVMIMMIQCLNMQYGVLFPDSSFGLKTNNNLFTIHSVLVRRYPRLRVQNTHQNNYVWYIVNIFKLFDTRSVSVPTLQKRAQFRRGSIGGHMAHRLLPTKERELFQFANQSYYRVGKLFSLK